MWVRGIGNGEEEWWKEGYRRCKGGVCVGVGRVKEGGLGGRIVGGDGNIRVGGRIMGKRGEI